MSFLGAQLLSAALFLMPIGVLWTGRFTRRTAAWEVALDIPFALAIDLLGVLILTRFVPLESAVLASRPLWLVALVVLLLRRFRRGDRPAWPAALGPRHLASVATSAALAVGLGLPISRVYTVWDRPWHAPLGPSLAGQRLPFFNVYGQGEALYYHLSGDVAGVALRTLSLDVMSSNLALSLAHDVFFALVAATVALLLLSSGSRRFLAVVLGGVALLLHGPIPLRGHLGEAFQGYGYPLYFTLSYRPHVPVSALMLVGFLGVLAVRARVPLEAPPRRVIPILLATAALLAISDEASLGLLGLGLGAAWLVYPDLLGLDRRRGFAVLLGLAAALALPNLLFSGALAVGGPVDHVTWLPRAMVPALSGKDTLPLFTPQGAVVFFFDFLPFTAAWIGLTLAAREARSRPRLALAWMSGVILLSCGVLATKMRVGASSEESQRFFVAPFFATLLFGLLHLAEMKRGSFASLSVLLGLAVPPLYTLYWIRVASTPSLTDYLENARNPWAKESTYALDCRKIAGAHLGDRPKPTYVDASQHYVFTSCRPIFGPGARQRWSVKTLPRFESSPQLAELTTMVPVDADLDAICAAAPTAAHDPVCAYAVAHAGARCVPEGTRFLRCPLGPADRAALLDREGTRERRPPRSEGAPEARPR